MKLALALLLCFLACLAQAEGTLHLYNWNNYISAETASRFEAWCGCRLRQDYYSDNEEMLAKLEAGATGYDLLVPTGNAVQTLLRKNELRPLDGARLPHFANLDPAFANAWYDPGNRYSVPYATTVTLLGYVAVVDAFQHEVYERPDMSADERAATWSRLFTRFLPGEDWTGHEAARDRFWHRQLHVFGMPFYYVDYALAEVCALQLHRIARKDPRDALERYLHLCAIGGKHSFLGILKEGGLESPFEAGTLPPLVALVREELGL